MSDGIVHVHYDESTGSIVAWGAGPGADPYLPGHAVLESNLADIDRRSVKGRDIDHRVDKINPATKKLVDKKRADLNRDLAVEVTRAIERELHFTDQFVHPPQDRPRKGPFSVDWTGYREGVRRLSDKATPAEMVKAWPLRPWPPQPDATGASDAIPSLRAKV